jgi:HD-GYP domain-containing protein (c-di-GMP phosphodiesterase class II)
VKPIDTGLLLGVGIALSKEKDDDLLFETVLTAAMDITHCDGGTLYIKTDEALAFRTMITRSLGIRRNGKNEPIALPPVPLTPVNVCARAALDGSLIHVPDVYKSDKYDFSGPREYDALTGYRTVSMLVAPMENDYGDVIGVLQLINALDDGGKIGPFDAGYEPVILSLASQAAICLTNKNYAAEIERLLDSFVEVMSAAIDARSPYNANHTRNMVRYAERFIEWLNGRGGDWTFGPAERRQFIMSVWLHDIGKLVIPLEIMDKPSRLGDKLISVEHRFEVLGLQSRVAFLEGKIGEDEFRKRKLTLEEGLALIRQADKAGVLPDETIERIRMLAGAGWTEPGDDNGGAVSRPLLTPEELLCLSVRKGTLTDAERRLMESHVSMTGNMLSRMAFSRNYSRVPEWAASHHELLNGGGYPHRLAGQAIPREVRLLTIIDVFDALTARDRPYKPALPVAKALDILDDMARDGQLDGEILALFKACMPWLGPNPEEGG